MESPAIPPLTCTNTVHGMCTAETWTARVFTIWTPPVGRPTTGSAASAQALYAQPGPSYTQNRKIQVRHQQAAILTLTGPVH